MKCIFCMNERAPSDEHIFPLGIGGSLTIDRVCRECNSEIGSRVDSALTDNFLIRVRRAQLGLAGNSGKPPTIYEHLLGVGTLSGDNEGNVHIKFNEETRKLDIRAIPHLKDVSAESGVVSRQIIVDVRDRGKIPKIIQRERKRYGLPPLSDDELAEEVNRATQTVTTIVNPQVQLKFSINFAFLRHAMIKIAYELAFLWLGEDYLDDPLAAVLRSAILSPDATATDGLAAFIGIPEECDAFKLWQAHGAHHIACSSVVDNGICVAVRIFDIYAAVVMVSNHAGRYLKGADESAKMRFLALDAADGRMHSSPYSEELLRMAIAMTAAKRVIPVPDPLSDQIGPDTILY